MKQQPYYIYFFCNKNSFKPLLQFQCTTIHSTNLYISNIVEYNILEKIPHYDGSLGKN